MELRPMSKEEMLYCYAQSQQISMQTGLIGHLRGDMDSNGQGFFTTFFDFRSSPPLCISKIGWITEA